MVFGATFACAGCKVRFTRRESCPCCGSTTILALSTCEGRARYGRPRSVLLAEGALGRSARWATEGSRLAMPASAGGLAILAYRLSGSAAAGAGTLVALLAGVLMAGVIFAGRSSRAAPARRRVFEPSPAARCDTTLTGTARCASVEIASGLAQQPCLVYGIRGAVGDADVADAEGGDFDLELSSGERVLVSLEHAVLVAIAGAPAAAIQAALAPALRDLLAQRGIPDAAGRAMLDEVLVRDGDEVTVTGTILGGTVTSLGARGARSPRVIAGDAERLLAVEIVGTATEPRTGGVR